MPQGIAQSVKSRNVFDTSPGGLNHSSLDGSRLSRILERHTTQLEEQASALNHSLSYANAPVKGEWMHSQREKREKMRIRNQEYLDKLKYMITYRESKITEKIQSIERANSQREHKL